MGHRHWKDFFGTNNGLIYGNEDRVHCMAADCARHGKNYLLVLTYSMHNQWDMREAHRHSRLETRHCVVRTYSSVHCDQFFTALQSPPAYGVAMRTLFVLVLLTRSRIDLVDAFDKTGHSQISVMPVDQIYVSQYGIVVPSADGVGVKGLVEKPRQVDSPSNLASIGRYVLTSDIFDILRDLPTGSGEEIQLADALNMHAQAGLIESIQLRGKRFDCGSVDGFMSASAYEYAKRLVK